MSQDRPDETGGWTPDPPWHSTAAATPPPAAPPGRIPWPATPADATTGPVPPPMLLPSNPWAQPGWGQSAPTVPRGGVPTGPPFPAQQAGPTFGPGPGGYGPPPGWDPRGGPRPSSGGGKGALIAMLTVVLVLIIGAGAFWFVRTQTADSGTDTLTVDTLDPAPGDVEAPEPTFGSPTFSEPEPTVPVDLRTPEQQALDELEALRSQSLAGLSLDGRWVAQVASKSVGITDPMQTAENGTHTFYAVDILAESEAARAVVASPSQLLVLQSLDFGKISRAPDGQPYWVTLVDAGFAGSRDVEAWCAETYSSMSPAELANACVARTLTPPHS
jgi:hypothetical protein